MVEIQSDAGGCDLVLRWFMNWGGWSFSRRGKYDEGKRKSHDANTNSGLGNKKS